MPEFYSHGKLLLTSEYAVLDGALALAIPTKPGQSLEVTAIESNTLKWKSFNHNNNVWFETEFKVSDDNLSLTKTSDSAIAERLKNIFEAANKLSKSKLDLGGCKVETHLEFDRQWGLGTSSTLINNIANWLQVDAFALLDTTFGGSGYDIACAQNDNPILYKLNPNGIEVQATQLNWPFTEQLYFVYLNQKQNSRTGIADYKARQQSNSNTIDELSSITRALLDSNSLTEFERLIKNHNQIISRLIGQEPVSGLFRDFNGSLKNLGAWGGDFILVSSQTDPTSYFDERGYHIVIPFKEMIL
ncbi:GYDIA family GHMP kinase [Winogradskyella aurantiaca]|uniref:GYDIA family GHMP kinase n=1 Tax=Winogradskyella aurantiaca TaxID=2219558 RepID=UPI000E1DBC6C|nr:GYDIA family GHMP kinase [Winogradskyella aurantiaca]